MNTFRDFVVTTLKPQQADAMWARNVTACEMDMALAEIEQQHNSQHSKAYHLSLSAPLHNCLEQLQDYENTYCCAIGLADYQRISTARKIDGRWVVNIVVSLITPGMVATGMTGGSSGS